mgnify:CR=1 FL=1
MKKIKNFLIRLFSKKPTRHKQLPVPVHAEPKPQNRFVVYLDGIPSYFVQSCDAPSAFVNNDGETDDGTSYTVLAEDAGKILLFKQTDDDTDAAITYTIVLPETEDFINKEIIFKDISKPLDSGTTTLTYQFNLDIQYDWNPVTTSNDFYTLADVTHKVLILKFVKITPTSYAWIVVSAAGQELDVQTLQDDVDDLMADPDLVEFEDVDLSNSWVTHALNVQAQKKGSLISLRG